MTATTETAPRLVPPIPHRTPRWLAAALLALIPLSFLLVPLWIAASDEASSASFVLAMAAAGVVCIGGAMAWIIDRVDGHRSTEAKRRRSVVLGTSLAALLTVLVSAFAGSAFGVSDAGWSSAAERLVFGTFVGGSLSIWLAPILAIPAAALGTVLVARSTGARETGVLVLLGWVAGLSLIGATADPALPHAWAIGVVIACALVCLAAVGSSLRRIFWAMRLVRTPHRYWRLEVTEAHPDSLPDLPRLSSSASAVVLMLRDDSAGGPFRGADAFHPVAVLPRSAATWILTTLARATVALSIAATTVALSLTSL